MSLTSYAKVRPYAKAIRDELISGSMPPWLADRHVGHFENDPRLTDDELSTIVKWVAAGAKEGNRRDLPSPPKFVEGWAMGKPDVEFALPKPVEVPAKGALPNLYFTVDTNLAEDHFVSGIEIRPGNREVVHHITVFIEQKERRQFRKQPAIACTDTYFEEAALREQREHSDALALSKRQYLYSWTPGSNPFSAPDGSGRLIPAGSRLVFEVHYAPNGTPTTDRSRIGLRFVTRPVRKEVLTLVETNEAIRIPPRDPNYEAEACMLITREVVLTALKPHMHLRGHDMRFDVEFPDGRKQALLLVPNWNFDWQLTYQLAQPLTLPPGARIRIVAHYDNSPRNRRNPDPNKSVIWDDQSTGEMLAGMITLEEPFRSSAH